MLVLSRKVSEKILVGDDVKITCVRISPNCVRIGIEAPPHMKIVRQELVFDLPLQGVVVPGSVHVEELECV